ncbi:MAG: hypothetical protein ACFFEF_18945 [Candidatus Thorarchaeota archaeon]
MKEFGNERVCINGDDVLPIKTMSIDPTFFAQLCSVDDLSQFKSDREDLCYTLINLDMEEDTTYCVSQSKMIQINAKPVSAAHVEEALDFALISSNTSNEAVCSSCLYKYLITLTNLFENFLSDQEKSELILQYSKELVNKIASELSENVIQRYANAHLTNDEIIEVRIKEISKERENLGNIIHLTQSPEANVILSSLVSAHTNLYKLDSIFLFQVLSLNQAEDELTAITLLKLMLDTAKRILQTHDDIRSIRQRLIGQGEASIDLGEAMEQKEENRIKAEQRLRNLATLIAQISNRPS